MRLSTLTAHSFAVSALSINVAVSRQASPGDDRPQSIAHVPETGTLACEQELSGATVAQRMLCGQRPSAEQAKAGT